MNRSNSLRAAMAAALLLAWPLPRPSPMMPRCSAQVEALRAAIAEQRAAARCAGQTARSAAGAARSADPTQQPRCGADRKIATQEAPKLTFTNNRPTITAADGRSSIAIRANVQLDGALYGESPEGPLDHGLSPRLGGRLAQPGKQCRTRFQRWLLLPARALRRRRHHRARLQLPAAARTRRLRHRRSDAHQRRLDCVHRLRALHASSSARSRRPPTWTTAPSPEDLPFLERASASELSRSLGGADGRIGLGRQGRTARAG